MIGPIPGNSDGTNPGTRAESRCKTRACRGGGVWDLGTWNLLVHNIHYCILIDTDWRMDGVTH